MTLSGDSGRASCPLLGRIVEQVPGESVTVLAALERTPSMGSAAAVVRSSLGLELLAEAGSLVLPNRRMVAMTRAELGASERVFEPVACRAQRDGDEVRVELCVDGIATSVHATLRMSDSFPRGAPAEAVEAWPVEGQRPPLNGDALYVATTDLSMVPPPMRVVRWARAMGLLHLAGGFASPGAMLSEASAALPLLSSPWVVEGLLQLTRWLWYSQAGEGTRLTSLERAEWYRLPRHDEELVGHVRCRGTAGGLPCFDATAYGADRKPTVTLLGLRCAPVALTQEKGAFPRVRWQSFTRELGTQRQARPE